MGMSIRYIAYLGGQSRLGSPSSPSNHPYVTLYGFKHHPISVAFGIYYFQVPFWSSQDALRSQSYRTGIDHTDPRRSSLSSSGYSSMSIWSFPFFTHIINVERDVRHSHN